MPNLEAEAIVLRHYSLSESDRIVIFLTREYGKLRAVGRGLKKTKSKMAGALEPLSHVKAQFYVREGAELSHIRQCESIHSYLGHGSSLRQFFGFNYFAEIVNELVQENNPNDALFRLLLACLKAGGKFDVDERLLRYFEIWTLRLNGWLPNYDYCSACRKCVKDSGFYALMETGQAFCADCCGGAGLRIRPVAAGIIRALAQLPPEEFCSRPMPADAAADLERLTGKLLERHLERRLKSYESLKEILSEE